MKQKENLLFSLSFHNNMQTSSANEIKVELGKIKGYIEKLKIEVGQEKVNRLSQRQILVEIKSSLEKIKYFFLKEAKIYLEQLKPSSSFEEFLLSWKSKIGQEAESYFDSLISSVNFRIYELDTPASYRDEDVRKNITDLIFSLDSFITNLSDKLSLPLTGIARVEELVNTKPFGLNENWAVASCYLSAMEIAVNKRLKKEGIESDEKDFASKFKTLSNVLENKGVKISELEKELPSAFWKLRNQVIHAGYTPTEEELDLIIKWVKKILKLMAD
jgi:hypothetical protein